MWIPSFIPLEVLAFIALLLIFLGVVLYAVSVAFDLPFLKKYKVPLQVISIAFIIAGVYWTGGIDIEEQWRTKLKDAETKLAIAEEKSKTVNTQIKYVYDEKRDSAKHTQDIINREIQKNADLINKECTVSTPAIQLHNQSAKGVK